MRGGTVEPLFEEPERHLVPPLRPGSLPWQVAVHRLLTAHANRFDGVEGLLGERGRRFIADCAALLQHHDDARVYIQTVTRVRWAAVRSLLKISPHRHMPQHRINQAVNVIRDLHNRIIAAAEATATAP